ncbi:MAG: hypothetical protein ACNS62_12755 [Candidatus Cyclobacteriaceae bacterium M3_2C_046]
MGGRKQKTHQIAYLGKQSAEHGSQPVGFTSIWITEDDVLTRPAEAVV